MEIDWNLEKLANLFRVVIKSRELGISPGYYESGPRLISLENRIKIEPEEISSCLIPRLLVIFTRQLWNLSDNPAFQVLILSQQKWPKKIWLALP